MQITEQNKPALVEKLGQSWFDVLVPFIASEAYDNIFKVLKATSQAGKVVIPKASELFTSFKLCPRHKVRAIVILQCPYATERVIKNKEKVIVGRGIPMDCKNIEPYQQPSLFMWYQAIENQYGFDPDNDLCNDLSYLLEEEGVLLINSALSVEMEKVDSHASIWAPFTKYLLQEVVSKLMCGLPIWLIGTGAQKYEQYINPLCHHILKTEHPAVAAAANREWKHLNTHKTINTILKENTGQEIQWLRKKGEKKKVEEYPNWVLETKKIPSAEALGLPWKD